MPVLLSVAWSHVLILLVLASPLALLAWGMYRLRSARVAGAPVDQPHPYLLAKYAAAVQASNLREGKAFPLVGFLVLFEVVQLYTTLYLLLVWRSLSYPIGWGLLGAFTLLAYRLIVPRLHSSRNKGCVVAAYEALSPQAQSAWGILGHTLLWGSFCFIFVCIILREYYL
jgi:hypothetical protein